MTKILTAGYQGESIDSFVRRLVDDGVDLLIDVRRFAQSRKPGFSKSSLGAALRSHGVEYIHFPELGMPKHLLAHRSADNRSILDAYDEFLPSIDEHVHSLIKVARGRRSCLMCFEADANQCHRSRLADYLRSNYPEVEVIGSVHQREAHASTRGG